MPVISGSVASVLPPETRTTSKSEALLWPSFLTVTLTLAVEPTSTSIFTQSTETMSRSAAFSTVMVTDCPLFSLPLVSQAMTEMMTGPSGRVVVSRLSSQYSSYCRIGDLRRR